MAKHTKKEKRLTRSERKKIGKLLANIKLPRPGQFDREAVARSLRALLPDSPPWVSSTGDK